MRFFTYTTSLFLLLTFGLSGGAEVYTDVVHSVPQPELGHASVGYGEWVLPQNPPKGYVRVEMACAQICHSDRRVLAGTKSADVLFRELILGHEGVGLISALSPEAAA